MVQPGWAADTGWKYAESASSDTGWSNFTIKYLASSDDAYASNTSGRPYGYLSSFSFGVPAGATIDGIAVEVEGASQGTTPYSIQLSWNYGNPTPSWTTAKSDSFTSTIDATDTLGGSADTWGRTWNDSEFSNTNFGIRLYRTNTTADWRIDRVRVIIYYTLVPTFDQDSFRARNDDGSESAATWQAPANTNWTQAVDHNFRVRFVVQETSGFSAADKTFQLEYNHNGSGWNDATGASSVVRSWISPSVADGADTTQQVGSGTFVTPNGGFDEVNGLAGGASLDFSGSDETEVEYCIQIRSADVSNNDTVQLRVKGLDTYTSTPTITVKETGVGGGRDVAIYRDATDTTNYNSTSATDVTWDTTVREDTLTYSRTGDTVTLKQSGHYLVNWNLSGNESGANRAKLEGFLNLDGTSSAYGRGWGYLRDTSTTTESYAQGATIIETTAGSVNLKLQVFRQDTNTASQGWVRRTNLSGISLLKLDDSWSYARYRKTSGTQYVDVMEATAVTLALTVTDEQDTGFSRTGGTITLINSGHYLITYNIGIDSTGAAVRQNYVGAVFLEGTEVPGTRTTGYIRESDGDLEGGLSFTGIIVADANDDLEIKIWGDANDGDPTATVDLGTTAVALVKLPDDADYIRLSGTDGTQNLSTSESNISFNTEEEADPSFEYSSGSPDEIKVLTGGDYLFTWSVFARKPTADGTREHIWTKLAKKGTPDTIYQWALAGNYIRGSQGTPAINCPSGGASVGAIITAAADDVILLKQQNEASDANAVIVSDRYAIQGVNIDSLFDTTCRFTKYRSITIQSSQVLADLTDFPVMVTLTGAEFQAVEDDVTDAQGDDIIFRDDPNYGDQLSHEIEVYDTTNDKLVAWVKVPSVSGSSNTTFYMVYGNACITTSSEDAAGVWTGYEAVYHMDGSANTTDSTGNGHTGTDNDTDSIAGQIADARDFTAADPDQIDIANSNQINTMTVTVRSFSLWFKAESMPGLNSKYVLYEEGGGTHGFNIYLDDSNGTTTIKCGQWVSSVGGWLSTSFSDTNNLHHLAFLFDSAGTQKMILDGVEVTGSYSGSVPSHSGDITIGRSGGNSDYHDADNDSSTYAFDGVIDEFRIANSFISADWIKTEHNNQNAPGSFYQLGTETLMATAVSLISFTAKGKDQAINVEWQTAREFDNVGFHLYRATSPAGPYERLTDKLISATVVPGKGGSYNYVDRRVKVGSLYYYKLEDIDIYGKHTRHGPICVDWDADGMPDDWEITHGLNPWVNDADFDYDGDGLSNLEEYERGLDPFNADTDGDGIPDGEEDGRLPARDDPGSRTISRGVEVLAKDDSGMTLVLTTGGFEAEVINVGNAEYEQLKIADYVHGYTGQVGAPQLPLKGLLIDVPPGKVAELTEVDSQAELHSGYRIYPAPEAVLDTAGGMAAVGSSFYQDDLAYGSDGFYPQAVAALGDSYLFGDQLKQQVIFYPTSFNPASGQLHLYRRIELRIDFVDSLYAQSKLQGQSPWQPPSNNPGVLSPIAVGLAAAPALVNPISPLLSSLGAAITAWWSPPDAAAGDVYKIITDTEGIHRLTKDWLEAGGLDTSTMSLSHLRLYHLGAEVAIEVFDQNSDDQMDADDYIRFYAAPLSAAYSKYSNQNVYWLTLSGGTDSPLRMDSIPAAPAGGDLAADFADSARHEQNQTIWLKAPGEDDIERWFFNTYVQGTAHGGGGLPVAFTINVPDPTSLGTLAILMAGQTETSHEVRVAINGVQQDFSWTGISYYQATLHNVPLVDGDNTVTLQCLSADGNDSIIVDWFKVDYWREYVTATNTLKFTPDSGSRYAIDGFSSDTLLAYDISNPAAVAILDNAVITGSDPYAIDFEPGVYGDTYLVLSTDTLNIPVGLIQDTAASLADAANGADYILITHRNVGWDGSGDQLSWLTDLVAHREAQGLRVFVADIEDIYDEFSFGIQSPQALKDFLAYAYANWTAPAPQYVMLVGDATYDPKGNWNMGDATAYLPTYMIYTDFKGETVTDQWFVTFSGEDAIADMYIGRLPAADATQAAVMVAKIIAYESALNTQTWQNNMLLIADNQRPGSAYAYEAAFEAINEDAAALIPEAMADPFRGYLNDYAATAFLTDDIIDTLNDGALIANYAGHGATQVLAEEHIFDAGDVSALTNADRLPFFVSMACEAGFFAYPENWAFPSLAEALLRSQNGAVAALMPTGMTTTDGQQILDAALFEAIFVKDIRQLGPAIADAKQTLLANGESDYAQLSDTFLLFGDPATKLKIPLPHVPGGVNADKQGNKVHLSWDAVKDCNDRPVAGYNIYRAASAAGPFSRINTELSTDNLYVDSSAVGMAGGGSDSSFYAVSAVDDTGFESAHSTAVKPASYAASSASAMSGCFISATQPAAPLPWILWVLLMVAVATYVLKKLSERFAMRAL